MKSFVLGLLAVLLAVSSLAQFPAAYSVSIIPLANSVAASSTNSFPFVLTTTILTNEGTTQISYTATNVIINSNYFTLPTNVWISVTNTFLGTNTVAGTGTNNFTVLESIHNTNSAAYYMTNVSHGTNIITTNYQFFNYTTEVPFQIIGTNSIITTNYTYGGKVIDVSRGAAAALSLSFKGAGASTGGITLRFQPSIDGVTTNTAGSAQSITLTANGTTTVATNVPLVTGPFGFLILQTFESTCTNAVTNIVFKVAQGP